MYNVLKGRDTLCLKRYRPIIIQGDCILLSQPDSSSIKMAKILSKRKTSIPKELAQKAKQLFERMPYESNRDRIQEDMGKILATIKVCITNLFTSTRNKPLKLPSIPLCRMPCLVTAEPTVPKRQLSP